MGLDGWAGFLTAEECRDHIPHMLQRLSAIDGGAEVRSVLEAFGVPRAERAKLIDDPAIVRLCARLIDSLAQEELDVVNQETAALLERDGTRRVAGDDIARLGEDPGIPQHAPADQDALHAEPEPLDDLLGLDAVAAAKNRNGEIVRDAGDEL